jgi:hypothetical protein
MVWIYLFAVMLAYSFTRNALLERLPRVPGFDCASDRRITVSLTYGVPP